MVRARVFFFLATSPIELQQHVTLLILKCMPVKSGLTSLSRSVDLPPHHDCNYGYNNNNDDDHCNHNHLFDVVNPIFFSSF